MANSYNGSTYHVDSKIYKWDGSNFVEFQSIPTHGTYDWKYFTLGGNHYLVVANREKDALPHSYVDSKIYKWNGTSFVEFQSIATIGGRDWEFFTMESDSYLVIANMRSGSNMYVDSLVKLTGVTGLNIGYNRICNLSTDLQNWANTYDPDWEASQTCFDRNSDSLALVALYTSTNGGAWSNSTNWLSVLPIDQWYGISINNNRVSGIDLSYNNLEGTLPSEIGNLSELTLINFSVNKISGTIPSEFGDLINLVHLHLTQNSLTGTIPSEFMNITKLKRLHLNNSRYLF